MIKNFSAYILLLIAVSCKPAVDEKETGFTFNKEGGAPIKAMTGNSISLISPATSPNFSSTINLRVNNVVDGEMVKLFNDSNCTNQVASSVAAGTTANFTISGLNIGTTIYSTKSVNNNGSSACSGTLLSYQYLGVAPTEATGLTLISPATTPNTFPNPTIELSGVVPGETVRLYKNAACTALVASGVATSGTIQLISSALSPATYEFHSKSSNAAGTSACSTASVTYQYLGTLPNTATTMTLTSPVIANNYVSTPTFLLSGGVVSGDTVRVYKDSLCATSIGSAVASTTSVSVTVSALAVGSYSFYTKSQNAVGTSNCSSALATYNYLGASPDVQVTWTANKETAVNKAGGGYKVYYSTTSGFNINTATMINVPYVAGPSAPTSVTISNLLAGTYYFKVVAYSALNPVGGSSGSTSAPSAQFSLALP